jgi:hypothetical protein
VTFGALVELTQNLHRYWLDIVALPVTYDATLS